MGSLPAGKYSWPVCCHHCSCWCVTLPDSWGAAGYMQCRARRHRLLEKWGTASLTSHPVPPLPRGHSVGENPGKREVLGLEEGPVGMRLDLRKGRAWDLDVCIKTSTVILSSHPHFILLASTH